MADFLIAYFSEMSIQNMTEASCILFMISGVLAVSAIILFFALNIPKCLRMVSGKYPVYKRQKKSYKLKTGKTEGPGGLEHFDGSEETLPLCSAEGTILLNDEDIEQI